MAKFGIKSIKKKLTLKNVVKGAAKLSAVVGVAIPFVQNAADSYNKAKSDATAAQAEAAAKVDAAMTPAPAAANPTGGMDQKTMLLIGGAVLLLVFVMRKH